MVLMTTRKIAKRLARLVLATTLALPVAASALQEMGDADMYAVVGQALIVSDKLAGVGGSGHTFYRMMLDAELGLNANIDRLQLGCGGYNEAVVGNACDIDFDYVQLLGRTATGGQAGAPGSDSPANSLFKLTRPYFEFAIKNDGDPTRRELVGLKIGSQFVDGYFAIGRYISPNASATDSCTNASDGAGALACHVGLNRLSGYIGAQMSGNAYGCFGLLGCTPNANRAAQDRIASFNQFVQLWGTRMNRIQTELTATSNPDVTIGLTLDVVANVNESLRFLHGFQLDPNSARYAADDFFLSFQREPVRYPTFNKSQTHSNTANPGWWMNVPEAQLEGLTAYDVATSSAALFVALDLVDVDLGQRHPDNCLGSLSFC